MLRISDTHPMDEYMALLSTSTKIFIDNERLDRAIMNAQYQADDYRALTLLELRIESSGSYQSISSDSILDFLERLGVDLDKRYRNKKTDGYSLDMKKVVDPLIEAGVAVDMLTAYKAYRSYRTYASFLAKLGESKRMHHKTNDGRIILAYDTTLQERENLRVYYRDIAVVSIPKIFSNIVTGPSEEYHLAWCDYPQADWRFAYNLFIRDPSNFGVMRSCEDAYEGLARIVEGDKFNPEVFKDSRKAYKVDCLKVFYNSRDNRPIPTAMRQYYMSRERYRKYFYDLGVLYQFKLPVPCESYFGYTQLLPEASYPDAFLSKGLNTPIQTMTSHVVNETVFGILKKFYDLGYTEDDIRVYYVRHDELIFMFKDTILKDAWVFEDCSQIHIDGFSPIKLDFHFGDYYQEEDSVLTEQVYHEMKAHPERISYYDIGEGHAYYPVPSVESLYAQFFIKEEMPDGSKVFAVRYYNYRTGERTRFVVAAMDREEALRSSLAELQVILGRPKYLLVRNDGLELMDSIGEDDETLLKVVSKYDSGVAVQSDGEE